MDNRPTGKQYLILDSFETKIWLLGVYYLYFCSVVAVNWLTDLFQLCFVALDDSLNHSLASFPFMYESERCTGALLRTVCASCPAPLKLPSHTGAPSHEKHAHGSAGPTSLAIRLLIAYVLLYIWTKLCRKCFSQLEKRFVTTLFEPNGVFMKPFLPLFPQQREEWENVSTRSRTQRPKGGQWTCWTGDSSKTWEITVKVSDLIQARVLNSALAHETSQSRTRGWDGASSPSNCIPGRSNSKLSLPTEGFCFDNMPFSNEKYFHQKVPHPVCA